MQRKYCIYNTKDYICTSTRTRTRTREVAHSHILIKSGRPTSDAIKRDNIVDYAQKRRSGTSKVNGEYKSL